VNLVFTPNAWADYEWWIDHDRQTLRRLRGLIKQSLRTPFEGTGKPEPLKYQAAGNVWSRRITQEHRLVYVVDGDALIILAARFHYVD
jgi:toxin YoeB